MPSPRLFPEGEQTVTIHLGDGTTLTRRTRFFEPEADLVATPMPGQEGRQGPLTVSQDLIECIALHQGAGQVVRLPTEPIHLFHVRLASQRAYKVRVVPEDIGNTVGFLGYPENPGGLYSLYWFYAHAIASTERVTRLGALLIEEGVPEAVVASGLERQKEERGVRVGQILMEQTSIPSEALERAVQQQEAQTVGRKRQRLGEILVEAGITTAAEIERALEAQSRRRGRRLGELLVEMGIVDERCISEILARKFSLPFVDLNTVVVEPAALIQVPREIVERFQLLPIQIDGQCITVALADPLALEGVDLLRFRLRKRVKEVVVTPSQLSWYLDPILAGRGYPEGTRVPEAPRPVGAPTARPSEPARPEARSVRPTEPIRQVEAPRRTQPADDSHPRFGANVPVVPVYLGDSADEGAITDFVHQVIAEAWRRRASHIHFETYGRDFPSLVRLRIDGVCETGWKIPHHQRARVIQRVKVLANLEPEVTRRPQEGRATLALGAMTLEIEVATLPLANDEDALIRLRIPDEPLQFEQLGLSLRHMQDMRSLLGQRTGLIVLAAPVGNGATMTARALLATRVSNTSRVLAVDDPPGIGIPGIRLVALHPDDGLKRANACCAALDFDPDAIFIGQLADANVTRVAMEASMDGHLVIATIRARSAPEAIGRLLDMGLNPDLVAESLLAVLSQRLVRRLCDQCRQPRPPTAEEDQRLATLIGAEAWTRRKEKGRVQLWKAVGCPLCLNRGYKGRIAIHELIWNREEIRAAILRRSAVSEIRRVARSLGMPSSLDDGLKKCFEGKAEMEALSVVSGV